MSLPPATILIKRKATDEPIDYLQVQESNGKRQRRASAFVFTRQQTSDPQAAVIPQSASSSGRRIKTISRGSSVRAQKVSSQGLAQDKAQVSSNSPVVPVSNPVEPVTNSSKTINQPRRFHISRSVLTSTSRQHVSAAGVGKKRGGRETVFVERRIRKNATGEALKKSTKTIQEPSVEIEISSLVPVVTRPQKKPGLAARSSLFTNVSSGSSTPIPRARVPSAFSADFVAQMQAYTLQEIGDSLAESESFNSTPSTPTVAPQKSQKHRFSPKVPSLRYHERHPEVAAARTTKPEMDRDPSPSDYEEVDDDSEYVIETYVRVPADAMDTDDEPKDFGLLILDSQPDIDEFYREEESDDEEDDEEEDENAENHYSADYPDEEVDSDDEFGRNAYNYRNRNASDLEEFDEDDATFSDEETDAIKYPWMKRPYYKEGNDSE